VFAENLKLESCRTARLVASSTKKDLNEFLETKPAHCEYLRKSFILRVTIFPAATQALSEFVAAQQNMGRFVFLFKSN